MFGAQVADQGNPAEELPDDVKDIFFSQWYLSKHSFDKKKASDLKLKREEEAKALRAADEYLSEERALQMATESIVDSPGLIGYDFAEFYTFGTCAYIFALVYMSKELKKAETKKKARQLLEEMLHCFIQGPSTLTLTWDEDPLDPRCLPAEQTANSLTVELNNDQIPHWIELGKCPAMRDVVKQADARKGLGASKDRT